jgi:transglutaminase-like putative cysteine protease
MRWNIEHTTRFTYAAPVHDSFNELRLQPFSDENQTVESFDLRVQPEVPVRQYKDFNANWVHHFDVARPHGELIVESRLRVATHPKPRPGPDARPAPMARMKEALRVGRCCDFMFESWYVDTAPETWRLAVDAVQGEDDAWQCALRLMRFVHGHLQYQSHSTQTHTHMRDVLAQRRGVCQDFAHVMLGLCRSLKIPALYVSGYLATETASATHAWIEVFVPGLGWQPLDPTHNCQPDETYVKIGVGRDYGDVAPVKGTYRGTTERSMQVAVRISRPAAEGD